MYISYTIVLCVCMYVCMYIHIYIYIYIYICRPRRRLDDVSLRPLAAVLLTASERLFIS